MSMIAHRLSHQLSLPASHLSAHYPLSFQTAQSQANKDLKFACVLAFLQQATEFS
jgi:hypothetical protein